MRVKIGESFRTVFNKDIKIHQDGTTPMYRDVDGTLWAMSGHSHWGHISVFSGKTIEDLEEKYEIHTNFSVGNADYAFSNIKFPEGVKARGSIWPFGLYICPVTHRFFSFFHNETGWAGFGTGYDSFGLCERPLYDTDFRHIGLMHSDDEGKSWVFDRWVLSANEVCFSEKFNPEGDCVVGQKEGVISLGSGDFSTYIDDEYIYLFYNIIHANMNEGYWEDCHIYVARSRRRTDGVMGDFVKYYNGAFCEAGNFGRETPIVKNAWHGRVLKLQKYNRYLMTSVKVNPREKGRLVSDIAEFRYSDDLINWSEPQYVEVEGKPFGNHYVAAVSNDIGGNPMVAQGEDIMLLLNHNGTDVMAYPSKIEE